MKTETIKAAELLIWGMQPKELILIGLLTVTIMLVAAVLLLALLTIKAFYGGSLLNAVTGEVKEGGAKQVWTPATLWAWIDRKFITAAVPLEQEEAILLHHDYDGIQELDNHLPPWWKSLFYATCVFAVVYMGIYHVWHTSPLQAEELAIEKKEAEIALVAYQAKAANSIDESNVELVTAEEDITEGHDLFVKNCKVCHGDKGQGGVGPNLTDEFWLHGGSVKDVFKSIKYGIPQKGMISWKATFKPNEIRSIASFVLSLQGSSPAGAKAPQGDKYAQPKGEPISKPSEAKAAVSAL